MNAESQHNSLIYLALFILCSIVMVFGLNAVFDRNTAMPIEQSKLKTNGFVLPRSLPLAETMFSSTNAKIQSTEGFADQWTLLAVGYTQCPDVCPTTLFKLNQVIEGLSNNVQPQIAFLSIDILPNEQEKLLEYMNYFNRDFIGLTTEKEQLDTFFESLAASYSINTKRDGTVDIEHSSAIFLISPDKRYVANFPYMLTVEEIIEDFLLISTNNEIR